MSDNSKKPLIIISREQYNRLTLSESQGVVPDYIYNLGKYIYEFLQGVIRNEFNFIKMDGFKSKKDFYLAMVKEFGEGTVPYEYTIEKDIIDREAPGNDDFNRCTVRLVVSTKYNGAFNKWNCTYENEYKVDKISIAVNMIRLIADPKTAYQTVIHELTHAYQFCKTIKKWGKKRTEMYYNNTYYNQDDDDEGTLKGYIDDFLYFKNGRELNAFLSALYATLEKYNANRNNWKEYLQKASSIDYSLSFFKDFKKRVENNENDIVGEIMKFTQNSEYADTFPSSRNMTKERYQKRLLAMVNNLIKDVVMKCYKVVGKYLADKEERERTFDSQS